MSVTNPMDHDRLEAMIEKARSIIAAPDQQKEDDIARVKGLFDLRLTAYKHETGSGKRFDEGTLFPSGSLRDGAEGEYFHHVESDTVAVGQKNIQTVRFATWIGLRMILGGNEQIPEILNAAHKPFGDAEGEAPAQKEMSQVISELMVRVVDHAAKKKSNLGNHEFERLTALIDFAQKNDIKLQLSKEVITSLCLPFGRSIVREKVESGEAKVATYKTLLGELEKLENEVDMPSALKGILIESICSNDDRIVESDFDLQPLFTLAHEKGIIFEEADIARIETKIGHMINNGMMSHFSIWLSYIIASIRKLNKTEGNPELSPEKAMRSAAIEQLTRKVHSADKGHRDPTYIMSMLWDMCAFKFTQELALDMDTIDVEGLIVEVMEKAFAEKPAQVTWLMQVFHSTMNREYVEMKGDRLDGLMEKLNIPVQDNPRQC